ncbi:MAG: anaerobic ribonucleoside-triphosphate reductase [Cetobacterium sp.]
MQVIKKDGTMGIFKNEKIIVAVTKSANRVGIKISEEDFTRIIKFISSRLVGGSVRVVDLHFLVELALDTFIPEVAKSYKDFRNYKKEFGNGIMDDIENQVKKVLYDVDRENSNSNTRYISTKRTGIARSFSKELYQKMFLDKETLQAMKDGYVYVHDLSDLILPQFNCCLLDASAILEGGFELEGIHYAEPKDITTAIGQLGDIIMIVSSQHFGGLTIPEIDKILSPYYENTIRINLEKYVDVFGSHFSREKLLVLAREDAYRSLKQGLQGLEIKLNTVVSARGSYPFTTFSFGNCEDEYQKDVTKAILTVRMEGHGKPNFKKNLIFPKLVFLHSSEKHGEYGEYEDNFNLAVRCSSKCLYPDYIGQAHVREGQYVSPMGKVILPNNFERMQKRCA